MPVSKAMQLIKGGLSTWINDNFTRRRDFSWQEGYGAFGIGIGEVDRTKDYLGNQHEDHAVRDFKGEFEAFLRRHAIPFDERYLLG